MIACACREILMGKHSSLGPIDPQLGGVPAHGVIEEFERAIKEIKDDLSLDTFCLKSFDATDAAFRMGGVLYNLLAEFRETVLPRSWFEKRMRAVRDFVFLVGADLISQGRQVRVRLAMPQADRPEFLSRLRTLSEGLPIAAQLEWSLTEQTPTHPDKIVTPIPTVASFSTPHQSP